ncbi:hypothetical protein [Halolamina salifodinae]|uniref:DUF8130 domain-containing protein n=1 Tax=Halolamina salifodinae TaxID=1202767 RepID=A0A8T4H2D0_9EURY|nr:hypothetical protein [Halolamina salifodinae]MBP1987785.1 hypothetical protein [Halolamina salifodinae]
MKKRRAFLASAAAVAGGGCLGRITADPIYTLSAKTVKRTESALVPRVTVVDEEVTTESPATIRVALYNRSFHTVKVTAWSSGGGGRWGEIDSAVSKDGQMRLTEPGVAERVGEPPCWFARLPLSRGMHGGVPVPALRSQRRTFAVGAANHGGCLEPGSYRFEHRYDTEDGVTDVDWAFELILSKPDS